MWRIGSTLNRRATCSGTASDSLGSRRDRSAAGSRNLAATAARISESTASFRCTTVSHNETGAEACSWRRAAIAGAGTSGSMVGANHSSVNCIVRLWQAGEVLRDG